MPTCAFVSAEANSEALDRVKRPWRIAYTCGSLAGNLAAVKAGLGITVLPKKMVSDGLVVIDGGNGLPEQACLAGEVDGPTFGRRQR